MLRVDLWSAQATIARTFSGLVVTWCWTVMRRPASSVSEELIWHGLPPWDAKNVA